jgi:hypothetical protein
VDDEAWCDGVFRIDEGCHPSLTSDLTGDPLRGNRFGQRQGPNVKPVSNRRID